MGHDRSEARSEDGTITRIYREDPEACAEAVRYALKIRAGEDQPLAKRAENPGEAK